jgi:hypothetical protein
MGEFQQAGKVGAAVLPPEKKKITFANAQNVAETLDWVRRGMDGKGLVLVAIGVNSVSYCKDIKISPRDAVALIEAQLPALRKGFAGLESGRVTRAAMRREDV